LIAGGLVMLGVVVLLVLIRSLFPVARPSTHDLSEGLDRSMRPTENVELASDGRIDAHFEEEARDRGRKAAAEGKGGLPHDVLKRILDEGWGEPRMLHIGHGQARVRIHACSECGSADAAGGDVGGVIGCGAQAGYLQGAFGRLWEREDVRVTETACRRAGHPVCDFEVRL
jgi:predicted hydrocarbon binding protein